MIDPSVIVILERASRTLVRAQKIEDLRSIVRNMEAKLARQFRRQGKLFVAELAKVRSRFGEAVTPRDWAPMWDRVSHETADGITVTVHDGTLESAKKGGERIVANLGLSSSFALPNPRAVQFLKDHAAERVAGVQDTTKAYIRTLMTKAVDEGWSYDKTAKTLIARFEEFAVGSPLAHIESRAHLVAVTESAFAYERANAEVVGTLMEGGLPMMKSWLTVNDGRVDEVDCGPNEEEGWIPADQDFQDGSSEPPAHPGCRCTAMYQVDPDAIGLPSVEPPVANVSAPQAPGTYDPNVDPSAKAAV